MHDYLRAIGFSSAISRKDLDEIIEYTKISPDERYITPIGSNFSLVQINKLYGPQFGLTIIGEYDSDDHFHFDHCFPYCVGKYISSEDTVNMKKISDKEAYEVFCDDINIGCPLIFFLQNISDYVRSCWSNIPNNNASNVRFGALSIEGTILLGTKNSYGNYFKANLDKTNRNELIISARRGDQEAIDTLTINDMNAYSIISQRVAKEDILTIVDTSFMPYGVECDQYAIIGMIMAVHPYTNDRTGENVWLLSVVSNDIVIDICINEKDLIGEPMTGRRFKGIIWLQGRVLMNT